MNGPIRRIVLWRWSPEAIDELRLRAREGLAYIRFAGRVDDLDFGEDLGFGTGPGQAYDLVLLRDHVDQRSWDSYVDDPHHKRVGDEIDGITLVDQTARIDFVYEGPAAVRGRVRHVALYWWRRPPQPRQLDELRHALGRLDAGSARPLGLAYGPDLGLGMAHADWALEAHLADEQALRSFLAAAAIELDPMLAELVDTTRTAHLQHRMLSG